MLRSHAIAVIPAVYVFPVVSDIAQISNWLCVLIANLLIPTILSLCAQIYHDFIISALPMSIITRLTALHYPSPSSVAVAHTVCQTVKASS